MDRPHSPRFDRRIIPLLNVLLAEEPVVAIHGPRSVGKSTILSAVARHHGVDIVDLDDPEIRHVVETNTRSFIDGPTPVCIDEYQKLPEVLDAIKARLNREGSQAGVALLTGSTRRDALPATAQALTGRIHSMSLLPLSQCEIDGTAGSFLPALFDDPTAIVMARPVSTTTRADYIARVCRGGFPLVIDRSPTARSRWFDNYIETTLERDAVELKRLRQKDGLRRILLQLAASTAQILNLATIAKSVELSRDTVNGHVRLLEDLFVVQRLEAWGTTLRSRVQKHPKIHFIDSGVASHLLGLDQARLAALTPGAMVALGHLLETFVLGEVARQLSWMDSRMTIGHWRTAKGDEVDLIVESPDGRVVAFEVKSNERVGPKDIRPLQSLRAALGPKFIAGIVLSTGTRSYTIDDTIHVCPIDRLWT